MMADEILERLARIEAGQEHLVQAMRLLQVSFDKVAVQETKQIQLRLEVDAMWRKVDKLTSQQDKCPITNLKTQVGWIWVFLSSLALGLVMMFINRLSGG